MSNKVVRFICCCGENSILATAGLEFSARPATNSMPVHIKDVWCTGRELSLLECGFRKNQDNEHLSDVAVKCWKGKKVYQQEQKLTEANKPTSTTQLLAPFSQIAWI